MSVDSKKKRAKHISSELFMATWLQAQEEGLFLEEFVMNLQRHSPNLRTQSVITRCYKIISELTKMGVKKEALPIIPRKLSHKSRTYKKGSSIAAAWNNTFARNSADKVEA
jgi:hypothetical protein